MFQNGGEAVVGLIKYGSYICQIWGLSSNPPRQFNSENSPSLN